MRLPIAATALALFAALLPVQHAAAAEPEMWLTLVGDPANPNGDVVQFQPDSVVAFSNLRTMRIRSSRTGERTSYDGGRHRSYVSTVHIDCTAHTARFRQLQLFAGPLWTGSSRVVTYRDEDMPPMAFAGMDPNPNERIVQAACSLDRVQTR